MDLRWWIRPLVRIIAALVLPLLVPAIIVGILWLLPGNPVDIICPPSLCTGGEELAAKWRLDQGPFYFYKWWIWDALHLDLGKSWRAYQGMKVTSLMAESVPQTAVLIALSVIPLLVGSIAAAVGWVPRRSDAILQTLGLIPAVILALIFAAYVEIKFGALSTEGWPATLRLLLGAVVLGVADGALAGAVIGTRSVFEAEVKQRYIGIAILRGETIIANALPNVLPALVGQFRARMLLLLSNAVIVEVVLNISGLGRLLWDGTLLQDFGVVLAATWAFAVLSAMLLFGQAMVEVAVAMHVRRAPAVPA